MEKTTKKEKCAKKFVNIVGNYNFRTYLYKMHVNSYLSYTSVNESFEILYLIK